MQKRLAFAHERSGTVAGPSRPDAIRRAPPWIEGAVEDPGELRFWAQSMKSCAARLIRVRGLFGLRELTLELALNRTDGWGFGA